MGRKETLKFFTDLGGKQLIEDIKAAERLLARYDRRYSVRKRTPSNWYAPGRVEQMQPFERGLRLKCERGWVELRWVAADCVRVRWRDGEGDFVEPFSYAVAKVDWPQVPVEIIEGDAAIEIRLPEIICRVGKQPFRIGIETLAGQPVYVDALGLQRREDGAVRLSAAMQREESSYGLGERATELQLRGKRFALWNTDPPKYARGSDPLYYSIPFYLGVHQQGTYGIFWDNASRGRADVGMSRPGELVLESESGEARCYLFAGPDVKRVLARYTELTGRIQLPPLWSLGYHQCRFSYYPQEEMLKIAEEFRLRAIPCDVLYLDIHYMDQFRVFTWDNQRFPQFRQMIQTLHDQNFRVVPIIDPGIKIDPKYSVYTSGMAQDVFLKYPDNQPVMGAVWPGQCHFPDFTSPAVRAWWGQQMSVLTQAGIDGIWNDMCEPAVFNQDGATTLPDYVMHDNDGLVGTHVESHNVYGMLMGRASMEALEKQRPGLRPFNMIRAGFAGAQRYASSWTGDNSSDWDQLRLSISMTVNMGLSGAPMTGPDVGGFNDDANGELMTRWLQAACLLPYFRSHTSIGTAPQEPWSFGQPYEVVNRLTIGLRYRLLPYLYSVVAQCREYGWPVVRPIFMAEPDNPDIREIDDCYMLGDALLVAPVLEPGAAQRSVYLPAGKWYDYWTLEPLEGGLHIDVMAPLERLPLFVRAGAALPHWPDMRYVGEKPVDTLVYRVYPGAFETILYEDQGEGLDYQQGNYRWVYISCGWNESRLVINRRVAGRFVPEYKTIKLEVVGFDEEPTQVRIDRQGAPLWFYDEGLLELTIDDFQQIEIMRKPLPTDTTLMHRPW